MKSSASYKYNFGWGDTYGIRDALIKVAPWLSIAAPPIEKFGYPKHEGEDSLVQHVKKLLKIITQKDYEYVLITQGCTHALNAYVAAEKKENSVLSTRRLYFAFYPGIAENHNLPFSPGSFGKVTNSVQILDSPSNPEGIITTGNHGRLVWDCAYHTPTYGVKIFPDKNQTPIPDHVAVAGSLSKLTGVNGIRLGWLATNDQMLYEKASRWATFDVCGVSGLSQWLGEEILSKVCLDTFWKASKAVVDNNKTEIEKLSYLFGNQKMPELGMFAFFEVDRKLRRLFDKASVYTTPGTACGDDKDSMRINLAHFNDTTKEMVKAILKADKK